MNKRRIFWIIAIIVIVIAIGWYFTGSTAVNGNDTATDDAAASAPQGQAVSVMTLAKKNIAMSNTLPGRVSAFRQSQVRPQVNGIVTERLFEEGAVVEQGQQLYQIDDARYKAALTSAEADLQSARSNINAVEARVKRYDELVKINAVSRQEYDDVKAQADQANAAVAVANAAVEVARVNLDYTKVYAPISGRIGRTLITEGALVTANQEQPLTVITQLDPVYVDMQQSGAEAMAFHKARTEGRQSVPVTILIGENKQEPYAHQGTVKFSEVTIDETTGSITLRAVVPNPDDVLLPGLFVRAILNLGEKTALLVPQRATSRTAQGALSVWTVGKDNQAHMVTFETSGAYEDNWIVESGLNAGDTIIIEGYQKVSEGAVVSPSQYVAATENEKEESVTPSGKQD